MQPTIVARDRRHLLSLIQYEIESNGISCDLNHIDVSLVTDMSVLFSRSDFNGDILNWNVSNVLNMNHMFARSKFNGDISKWDVSQVENMNHMFSRSKFNGDISKWNVANVQNVMYLFTNCKFRGDLSEWKPYKLVCSKPIFFACPAPIPYWANCDTIEERRKLIDAFTLYKELKTNLAINNVSQKKKKI